ncbi:ABC transporter permease [Candidatus Woesearchaeota archaeon]|nr:ABC transporter permease [Candidatus Woesearchaeota archaeon]RLE41771.1 MAG: ABC transporter permease [Candidatus Woesearchaeota archaeon]
MLKDYFVYVWKHLRRRRLRSWLTLIGVFIGMAAVVSLVSISQGMQDAIVEQFEKVGADRIIVTPGGALAGPLSAGLTPEKLTDRDVAVIRNVRGVAFAVGLSASTAMIKFKDEATMGYVMGMPIDSETLYNVKKVGLFDVEIGRDLRTSSRYEAVLGHNFAKDAFSRNITVRDTIEIKGKEFNVVGIQKKVGTGLHDIIIRIPKQVAKDLFGIEDENNMIVVRVAKGYSPEVVAESIKQRLRREHDVKEGEEDFSVETAKEVVESFLRVLGIVQVLIVGVAAISLVVGGVGIMNTMYTAVVERTREIGIMKAIGAKNSDILTIFLIESGMLGLTGGAIGVIIGLLISKSVELLASKYWGTTLLKAHISPGLIIGVLLFSFALGSIAGLLPARKAAKMQPVEALRH